MQLTIILAIFSCNVISELPSFQFIILHVFVRLKDSKIF